MPHQRRLLSVGEVARARFGVVAPFSSALAIGGPKVAKSSLACSATASSTARKYRAAATALLSFARRRCGRIGLRRCSSTWHAIATTSGQPPHASHRYQLGLGSFPVRRPGWPDGGRRFGRLAGSAASRAKEHQVDEAISAATPAATPRSVPTATLPAKAATSGSAAQQPIARATAPTPTRPPERPEPFSRSGSLTIRPAGRRRRARRCRREARGRVPPHAERGDRRFGCKRCGAPAGWP